MLLGTISATLLLGGGLGALQNVITTLGFPFCVLLVFMAVIMNFGGLWIRAYTSNARVSFFELIGSHMPYGYSRYTRLSFVRSASGPKDAGLAQEPLAE